MGNEFQQLVCFSSDMEADSAGSFIVLRLDQLTYVTMVTLAIRLLVLHHTVWKDISPEVIIYRKICFFPFG